MISYVEWLASLEAAELHQLLIRRPDVLHPPEPHDLTELAQRLASPTAVSVAVGELTTPEVEVAAALALLGHSSSLARLAALLDPTESGSAHAHAAEVSRVFDALTAWGLTWRRDEMVALVATLDPPIVGVHPLRESLHGLTRERLRVIQRALQRDPAGAKAAALDAIVEVLHDPASARAVVDSAPAHIRERLLEIAADTVRAATHPVWEPADGGDNEDGDDGDDDEPDDWVQAPIVALTSRALFADPGVYRLAQETHEWASGRGLLFGDHFAYGSWMPPDVALAIHREPVVLPFSPREPLLAGAVADPGIIESESAAAVSGFLDRALAVLDHVDRVGAAQVKSGGVGSRELTKIAKACGTDERLVRLTLELAGHAGLLRVESGRTLPSPVFAVWRDASPAERATSLIAAWWRDTDVPTASLGEDRKTLPVLVAEPPCPLCAAARHTAVGLLAERPGSAPSEEMLTGLVVWRRPLCHLDRDGAGPLQLILAECHTLGVLGSGALSTLGRYVWRQDWLAVTAHLDAVLPRSTDGVTFGSDLTAVVAGAPTRRVTRLLDGCATRESHGHATMWRFSPPSIRAALDRGVTAGELEGELAAVATKGVPQALTYLVSDVARRHGLLRVSGATAMIVCADPALLAEVAHDKRLAALGPRLLAPTVLSCAGRPDDVVAQLRARGYFPMPEADLDPDGARAGSGPVGPALDEEQRDSQDRAALTAMMLSFGADEATRLGRFADGAAPDGTRDALAVMSSPAELAERLARVVEAPAQPSLTERSLAHSRLRVSPSEVRLLAHAIDHAAGEDGAVVIAYAGQTGGVRRRRIREIVLAGDRLYAFCELSQDGREFLLRSILAVEPR